MFEKKIEVFADILIENDISQTNDREIIVYGISTIIEITFNILSTIVVGYILGLLVESLIFLCAFSFIRTYSGGYHCKSAINCYLLSIFTVIIALMLVKICPVDYSQIMSLTMLLLAIPIIIKLAPVETETKLLDDIEKKHYRNKTIRNLIIECLIIGVLFCIGFYSYGLIISFAIFTVCGLLIVQKIVIKRSTEVYK